MIKKFRVWATKHKEWRYYEDDYILKPNGEIWEYDCDFDSSGGFVEYLTVPYGEPVVEFYTGLKDMNGREIYEGDIIVHHYPRSRKLKPEIVTFDPDRGYNITFYTIEKNATHKIPVEVIGNIHQTPELLS